MPVYDESLGAAALGRLRHVHATFHRFDFPKEGHDFCFSDTCIYWRPRSSSAEEDAAATGTD